MGFFDLNIPYTDSTPSNNANSGAAKSARIKIVIKVMELGYTGIAYNRTIKGVMSDRDSCSIPLLTLSSLLKIAPFLSSSVALHRELLGVPRSSPFRQYKRLTVCVDNALQSQALNIGNPVLKTYDIVAVRPLNQTAFDHACEKAEVDIISIDFSDKVPFRLKLPMVKAALKRGVYFEIMYSDLIVDAQLRRQMISNVKLLVEWTRGKNVIICSAAPSACEVRGPNDVANLASLLGLSTERAKASISKNCSNLLGSALRRRNFFKETIRVEAVPSRRPFDIMKPLSADWLNWDPISSGEGDLMLDDIANSFSDYNNESKTVKAIDFGSVIDNKPSHGFQVKDLISGTTNVTQSSVKGKSIFSTFEPVELSVTASQASEKSSKLNLDPKTDKIPLDDAPSLTSALSDSQRLNLASAGTKTSTESDEMVNNITIIEEEREIQNDSHVEHAVVETESQCLQPENCIPCHGQDAVLLHEKLRAEAPGNELTAAITKDNMMSQSSVMDIEPDASCNITGLEVSSPFDNSSILSIQNKDSENSKGAHEDSNVDTIMVDDVALNIDTVMAHDKIISHQQPGEEMRVKDEPLVVSLENLVEFVMEEQKLAEADDKIKDLPSVLGDESLHDNVPERIPIKLPVDGADIGSNPFPESNGEMTTKDTTYPAGSAASNEIQEVTLEGPKRQRISEKPVRSQRIFHQGLLFPLRRTLYPVSFKRKARKSEHRVKMS